MGGLKPPQPYPLRSACWIKPGPHCWEASTLTTAPSLPLSAVLRLWTIYFDKYIFILTLRTMAISLFSPKQWLFLFVLHQPLHLDLVAAVGNQNLSFQWNPWKYLTTSRTANAWWKPDWKILNNRYVRDSTQLHVWKFPHLKGALIVWCKQQQKQRGNKARANYKCSLIKHWKRQSHCSWYCWSYLSVCSCLHTSKVAHQVSAYLQ